jgi:hypothetical protein
MTTTVYAPAFWSVRAAIARRHTAELQMFRAMEQGLTELRQRIQIDRRTLAASE